MNVAAVLAGGSGVRMGAAVPKQFLCINKKPVIIRSISAFIDNPLIDICIVSVEATYIDLTKKLIEEHISTEKKIYITKGGKTRGDTLLGVLEFMKDEGFLSDSIALTHDAARPFITDRIIRDNIKAAELYGACGTCVRAVDTMLISSDGYFIDSIPDRETVFHAQTPQSFKAKQLYGMIKRIPYDIFSSLTDGCSVFLYHNKKVALVEGENFNIKITYPEDMEIAQLIAEKYFDRTE